MERAKVERWMGNRVEGNLVDTTHELHFPYIANVPIKINTCHEYEPKYFMGDWEDVVNNTTHGSTKHMVKENYPRR